MGLQVALQAEQTLLSVPYGIETKSAVQFLCRTVGLLIVPYGIETAVRLQRRSKHRLF